MEENKLIELGLTLNESKTYETLLIHGKLGAGDISKFSRVPYSRIYDVLGSLEQKKLVQIIPEKSKKFVPSDPNQLMKIIKSKERKLDEIKEKIKTMKKNFESKEKNPVVLVTGKKAFYDLIKTMKKPKRSEYSLRWSAEYRPEWERDYKENIRKKIDEKILVRYDEDTKENLKKWSTRGINNLRKFDNEGVVMNIIDEKEILITLINSNSTLLIRDKAFIKVMRKFFEDSYKNAEKVDLK
jgi:sugar-specific transcriptional regulator TrmB